MPDGVRALSVDEAIAGADVVMMLRVQRERLEEELGDAPGEYLARYGLTAERLAKAAPNAVVMHPGPMNRGVEIESTIADDPERSLITLQVEMGVAARMACLEMLLGLNGGDLTGASPAKPRTKQVPPRLFSNWQRASASRWLAKPWTDSRQKVPLGESKRARSGK